MRGWNNSGRRRISLEKKKKKKRGTEKRVKRWEEGEKKRASKRERGSTRVFRARYVRVRKWTERIKRKKKKEKKKNTNYLYIFILAWSNTCTMYRIVVCASSLFRWKWKLRTVQLLPSLIVYLCRKGNDIEFNE